MNYIKASSNFSCGMKFRGNCKKCTDLMYKIVADKSCFFVPAGGYETSH